ncbi:glycosyltransferase family 2 protein [Synechococcus sp. ATX 2A4]|uniref:glycosyltransferase family 2 protein n=1 Tax=Synechococcus sp. ATX 2A4 TaxID=2823727 RepID=UPI0020CF62B5|nr:glycosyltransferase family A protein [Synechococcus sp. ATX 2A4]MCP9884665.1 glycosyltransferase family 2 protein [Synechococcus sp. ATX 2A4]
MKVSVIVPVLNGERFLPAALESVLVQPRQLPGLELELIVVDNGSDDGTVGLVEQAFGDRVQLVQEPCRGIAHARNAGLALATAPLIAFLDADDLWRPGKLALQCRWLAAHPEQALVFCHGDEFSDPPGAFPCRPAQPLLIASALLARRAAFEAAGPFPPVASGEFIAWIGWTKTLALASGLVPELLVRRRVHASNTTRAAGALRDYAAAMHWLIQRRRSHGPSPATP